MPDISNIQRISHSATHTLAHTGTGLPGGWVCRLYSARLVKAGVTCAFPSRNVYRGLHLARRKALMRTLTHSRTHVTPQLGPDCPQTELVARPAPPNHPPSTHRATHSHPLVFVFLATASFQFYSKKG